MEEDETEIETGTKELTKLERMYMERAHQRHKQNIVKDQICWGKKFEGQSFISKPDRIIFSDFETGKQVYSKTIILTNVSFTFNSYKVLDLEPSVKDYFDIEWTPPGKLSAGLTSSITIHFKP